MKFEIKSHWTGSALFSLETESLKLCVEAAVRSRAYLGGADLRGADLRGADLRGADLHGADLHGAYLHSADLRGAYLRGADLSGAYLRGADLSGADLRGADLHSADLHGTYLRGADGKKLTTIGDRPYLTIGPLGSRNDTLMAWLTDAGVYVNAGCFWDTLEKFRAAVDETHGSTVHGHEYRMAIKMIELHADSWTPVAAKPEAAL